MIPIQDKNFHETTPYFGNTIIGVCILVFLYQYSLSPEQVEIFHDRFALIPSQLFAHGEVYTLLTNVFLHADLFHLLGNMLFIVIFADNIEHAFGHVRFVLFYLLAGIFTSFAGALLNMDSSIPCLGASGAIMAVCGAYFILYPKAEVTMHTFGWQYQSVTFDIQASWVMAGWVTSDIIGYALADRSMGGTAYEVHIAGFLLGISLGRILKVYDCDYDGYILPNGVWVRHNIKSHRQRTLERIERTAALAKKPPDAQQSDQKTGWDDYTGRN